MGLCTKCGKQLREDARYCIHCGTEVGGAVAAAEQRPLERRAIPWWLGVAVGILVVAVIGVAIGRATQPADGLSPASPQPSAKPAGLSPEWVIIDDVDNAGLLRTSPFYFVKVITRDVQSAFTFGPIDKACLKLRFAHQDALAIREMCLDENYLEASLQCLNYEDNFFSALAYFVKAWKQGDDIDALMTDLITAHHGHRMILADALRATDGSLREAFIGAVVYTSAPLEQTIMWIKGHDEAVAFHSNVRNDFSGGDANVWTQIEERFRLSPESAAALANAMSSSASEGGSAPVIVSLRTDATQLGPGATCHLTCGASDPDGDSMTYQWLTADGWIDGQGDGVTWTAPAYAGTYQVTVVVSDDTGNRSRKTVSILVEAKETPYPGYLGNELFAAAIDGSASEVLSLLGQGADVDARGDVDQTPLHEAAFEGHTEIAEILLVHGADVDARDERGITPLRVAAQSGRTEVVMVLLDRGAFVNTEPEDGFEPLHIAAACGHVETARALLDRGADLNARNRASSGVTALHLAAQEGHVEMAQLLLDRGTDVDVRDWNNRTPLQAAAMQGHTEAARLLLEQGADVNAREAVLDFTPLHLAAFYCHTEVARLLLEQGADVNALAQDVATPLLLARADSCPDMVTLLEEYGGVT